MFDHYPRIELPITIDEFHRLPRNAGYKYEYFDRKAVLSPRPKSHSCVRDLSPVTVADQYRVEPLPVGEILDLLKLFTNANAFSQPWQSLDSEARFVHSRDAQHSFFVERRREQLLDLRDDGYDSWESPTRRAGGQSCQPFDPAFAIAN